MTSSNESCNCRKDILPGSPTGSAVNSASKRHWNPAPQHYCIVGWDTGQTIREIEILTAEPLSMSTQGE
jgi:hypothetical protein